MVTPDRRSGADQGEVERTAVQVEGRFRSQREPRIVAVLIVVFLGLAMLKPWSSGQDGAAVATRPPAAGSPSTAGSVAVPTPTTTAILDPNGMDCLADDLEQMVIIERWAGHEVRSWIAVTDLADASGPTDPRLVTTVVFSSHVVGLGICAPLALDGPDGPAATVLGVMAIGRLGFDRVVVQLGRPPAITRRSMAAGLAVLYGPPPLAGGAAASPNTTAGGPSDTLRRVGRASSTAMASAGSGGLGVSPTWPVGAYAIAFRFALDAPKVVRLVRVDLVEGAGRQD